MPMTGWFAENVDYLSFAALVAALYAGWLVWLRHRGCRRGLPLAVAPLLAAILVTGWFLADRAGRNARANTRQKVELLLPIYAREFQRLGHARVATNVAGDDPLYLQLIETQIRWLDLNPSIADIYTFRPAADGRLLIVVDSETDYDHNGRIEGPREQRIPPGTLPVPRNPARNLALAGQANFDENVYTDPFGTWVSAFVPLRDADGRVEAVMGVDVDAHQWLADIRRARGLWISVFSVLVLLVFGSVTLIALLRRELEERQRTAQELRDQSALRHMVFDQAPGGVALADLNYRFVEVNEAFCRLLGYRREELLQLTFAQITHPEDIAKTLAFGRHISAGGDPAPGLEKRTIRKDGSVVQVHVRLGQVRDEQGQSRYLVGHFTDLTVQRQAESELHHRQRQLAAILAHTPLVLYVIKANGIFALSEGAGLAALGLKPGEVVGQSAYDLYAARPDILADIRRALGGAAFTSQRTVEGAVFEVRNTPLREPDGSVSGMIGIAVDVSARVRAAEEREKMEHKLLEVQKLESLGILAGGVAHDFNNLLTAMMGHASLARLSLGPASPVVGNLNQIEQAAKLAAGLCQQLLAYAGRGRLDPRETDLSALVRDTGDLIRVSVGSHARLQFNLAPDLPAIMADPDQLRQVLLNIVLNAAEAIGRQDGLIVVSTRLAPIDAAWLSEASIGQQLLPGDYPCLEITDNGPGMEADARARVFDPFFSTKGSGRGLGLAAALGIIRSHQGALNLWSQPGQGAHFALIFPPSGPRAPEPAPPVAGRHWRGSGAVLIVDDEAAVRSTAAQMIAYFGFSVRQAESGQQALEILREPGARFDLVLLDLTMPGMDGFATFTAIRQLRPDQCIVVFSGYSALDAKQRFAGQNLNGFLQKPFSADSLREALSQAGLK